MKVLICILGLTIAPALAEADTLSLTSNLSINGVVRYTDDYFYIDADYYGGTKHYKLPRSEVVRDEINNTSYNQGSPPPGVTAYEIPRNNFDELIAKETKGTRKTSGGPLFREPSTGRTILGTSGGSKANRTVTPDRQDKVRLVNNTERVGTLILITTDGVVLRKNGSDTFLKRNNVRFITLDR